jgi:hypothetical protein
MDASYYLSFAGGVGGGIPSGKRFQDQSEELCMREDIYMAIEKTCYQQELEDLVDDGNPLLSCSISIDQQINAALRAKSSGEKKDRLVRAAALIVAAIEMLDQEEISIRRYARA